MTMRDVGEWRLISSTQASMYVMMMSASSGLDIIDTVVLVAGKAQLQIRRQHVPVVAHSFDYLPSTSR